MTTATNPTTTDTDITGDYPLAIHEAGHAVVAHLVGIAIDHVAINSRGGYSRPVRDPAKATADKLWAEAVAISRKLVLADVGDDGRPVYVLRKGHRRFKNGNVRGTPAPKELVDRMEGLRKRANAIWKKVDASATREDRVKDLMHTLGGPVADSVFFNVPFEAPRHRPFTKAELRALKISETAYGYAGEHIGNIGARNDFRKIQQALKRIDLDGGTWREAREYYQQQVEKLVRHHRTTIERVAKALLRAKTLNGAELTKLIGAGAGNHSIREARREQQRQRIFNWRLERGR